MNAPRLFFLLICAVLLCANLVSPGVDARQALDAPEEGIVLVQSDLVGADGPSEFIIEVAHPDFDHGLPSQLAPAPLLVLPESRALGDGPPPRFRPPGELYRPPSLV